MVKIAKSSQNLFNNHEPKELKKSKLTDKRFQKEIAWKKKQFELIQRELDFF